MSQQVSTAHVKMFSANVMHLAQQKESRLYEFCRHESFVGESKFFDRIGLLAAQDKAGRHSKVAYSDTPHSRRKVSMLDKYVADLVDDEDKIRTIQNLDNEYAQAISAALAREMDQIIIDSALGNAYTGKEGTVAVALPNSQKLCAFDGVSVTGSGLNVETLRAVKKKFRQAEAVGKNEQLIFVCAAQQIDDLLGNTEVTSADFNTVKALAQGDVDTFMGFKFIQTELLPFTSAATTYTPATGEVDGGAGGTVALGEGRRCFAFTSKRCLIAAMGAPKNVRITEMPEYHYAHQIYGKFSMGAVRMEEVQLQEVICKEL